MSTPNTVAIIAASGTTYYCSDGSGTRTAYNGSNTPWSSAATSPIVLSLNDNPGPTWVPQPAKAEVIYSGGPPFANGRRPISMAYDNRTEQTGIQIYADSKDNAIKLLRLLAREMNTALYSTPAVLAVQGGANTGYTAIYRMDYNESTLYLVEPDGVWRVTATLVLAPFYGLLSAGETLLNNTSFNNSGTTSPTNMSAYATGSGDMIYEGSPLNIACAWPSTTGRTYGLLYAASAYSRTYSTTGSGARTTSSTGGASTGLASLDVSAVLTNRALKARFLVHAICTANAEYRIRVFYGSTITPPVFVSRWIHTEVSTLYDAGYLDLTSIRRAKGLTSATLLIELQFRSTDGNSSTVTLTSTQWLLYYDFAVVTTPTFGPGQPSDTFLLDSFAEQTGAPCLPHFPQRAYVVRSGVLSAICSVNGTLPRYWSGAKLWIAWLDSNSPLTGVYWTTQDTTVTVTHAPLYRTLRGAS